MLLAVVKCWIVLVAGQEDYFTASTRNTEDSSTVLQPTEPTASTDMLTNYSQNLEGVNTVMRSTVQYTSTESPSELELTHQEETTEQSELEGTTQFITDHRDSETLNGLSESTETGNGVRETNTGVRILVDIDPATSTVTGVPTSVSQSSTISNASVVTETTESSNDLLEPESTVASETDALTSEQVWITEQDATVPSYPDLDDVSSATEGPASAFTTPSTSFGKHAPSDYHCIFPGRFPARPSCTEYHVCRLAGFRFVHFKRSCHFGLQFSIWLGFCVPSYLSDCQMDPYFANVRRRDGGHNERGYSRSNDFDDDSEDGRSGEVPKRNSWFSLMRNRINLY